MAVKSLAVKYRPKTFDDVSEQKAIKIILTQQLEANETKNAYLFCGGAGTGKTTCARIFAQEINKHMGNPIEMDAASNNSVEDVREIIQQAKTKSLDSEYKVFIIDECHALSNTAWQAMLKLIEEPPAKSIFIFCTTDPQKIPKTILSRVQRYDFQRISQQGIVDRLRAIIHFEHKDCNDILFEEDALDYIAKLADGGMRDAITLLDKCIAFSSNLTLESVVEALGTTDYDTLFDLTDAIIDGSADKVIEIVEYIHMSGKDLKQFIKTYITFVLDICKYDITQTFKYLQLPNFYKERLSAYTPSDVDFCQLLLTALIKLNADIKWETNPKVLIESTLMMRAIR
jgi:DNA polymerase-3 subunit gamma/tau